VPVSDEERAARAALSRVNEPGNLRMAALVAELGAAAVLARLRSPDGAPRPMRDDLARRLAEVDPARELEAGARHGLRFVVPGDDEWPPALDDLAHGPQLHERGGTPVGLWVKGPQHLCDVAERAVAVVGSRSATTYGAAVAGDIAAGLSAAGTTVVSGAAFGIDQAAHRATLASAGPTVAVLACGADRAYPPAHRELLGYIADVGLVVSEAPIGGAPTRIRFLARNRLIAALAQGTVVVEAAIRSGALNTASWADGLGRVVMGVPGPVTSAPSQGVHELIRSRGALLVTRAEEVLEATAPMGDRTLPNLREPARPRDLLSATDRQVLDAVPVATAASPESISRTAGLALATVTAALERLRTAGLVLDRPSGWRLADRVPDDGRSDA
jgi:DNA processing protein